MHRLLLLSVCSSASVFAASISFTFDSSSQGWNSAGSFQPVTATNPAAWISTGGNPGGYVSGSRPYLDPFDPVITFTSPLLSIDLALSPLLGFDLLLQQTLPPGSGSGGLLPPTVGLLLRGGGFLFLDNPGTGWTHYQLSLNSIMVSAAGTISIFGGAFGANLTLGLDNVAITETPEPATCVLTGAALLALVARRMGAKSK